MELPALCSASIRPGPPGDQAQVTSCLVSEILENAECVHLEDLCVATDKLAWVLYLELVCLSLDGCLVDACVVAAVSALRTVRLPRVLYDPALDTRTVLDEGMAEGEAWPLPISHALPVSSTFCVLDGRVVAGPTAEEEALCQGVLTVVVLAEGARDKGRLCQVHKPGGAPLSDEQLRDCILAAHRRAAHVYHLYNLTSESRDSTGQ